MKLSISNLIITTLLSSVLLSSCGKDPETQPLRVAFIGGLSALNDGGFNEQALSALTAAEGETSLEWTAFENLTKKEMQAHIESCATQDFDVVICMGYDAAQYAWDAAMSHPDVKFILLDYSFPTEGPAASSYPGNLACSVFRIDQASFPCGFLAAWWAWSRDPDDPKAGYVAGPDIPNIRQFTSSFVKGVEYFNAMYGLMVEAAGVNAVSFADTLEGARLADSLINQGVDILFACAGQTGNGALYQVKERFITGIGVDSDQFYSLPAVGHYLLTSCMKHIDVALLNEILSVAAGNFHGGQTLELDLAGSGVNVAPYHDYETLVPDSIKKVVTDIKTGIINGTIQTGWTGFH